MCNTVATYYHQLTRLDVMAISFEYELTLTTYCDDVHMFVTCIRINHSNNHITRNVLWSQRMTLPNHNFNGSTVSLHII